MNSDLTKVKKLAHMDPVLLVSVIALTVLGTIMVYSASSLMATEQYGDSAYFLKRQVLWLIVGYMAMISAFFMSLRRLRQLAYPAWIGVVILIFMTTLSSFGVESHRAARWLNIFGLGFQPSEFAKPVLVLFLAAYLARKGKRIENFVHGLAPLLLVTTVLLWAVVRQPDFGTAVVLGITTAIMLFVGQARISHIGGLLGLGAVCCFYLVQGASYRLNRLLTFLDPWKDPQGSGFQIIQSFVAFQRGGLNGQGLGDGTSKLFYLPEAHTDFIYSVIAEELGLLGSMMVIILFVCIIIQGFRLALRIRDTFASLLALGLTTLIAVQSLMNMAVVMGLVPTKGLTLPLLSYGGSSIVATLGSIGILLSLSSTVAVSGKMAKRRVIG